MTTLFDALVAKPRSADEIVAGLDVNDPAVRVTIVNTIDRLVKELISPAVPLMPRWDEEGSPAYFDLEEIAGAELGGLVVDMFEDVFPTLRSPPEDAELARAVDPYFAIPTSERRNAFFRAWMAERAGRVVDALARALTARHPGGPEEDTRELEILRRIASAPLHGNVRYRISDVIDRRSGR